MEGKVHKVTRRYILAICGADTPSPIAIKCGMRVAPRNVINVSNFCDKNFGGCWSSLQQCCATAQPVIWYYFNSLLHIVLNSREQDRQITVISPSGAWGRA